MACSCRCKLYFLVFLLLFVLNLNICVHGLPKVPCYFIFGDSLADNGNNNHLNTSAKVNYLPYGIDFSDGPTGRFCNGRTTVDIIAKFLGFDDYIPPFATAKGSKVVHGVNYASGSAGIRDETGEQLGDRISLNRQLQNHQITVSSIANILGDQSQATKHLNKCLYSVGMGSNDYLNNYFVPQHYPTSKQYEPDQFAALLIQQYSQQLRNLYGYGARKVALFGLGPIGCTPHALTTYGTDGSLCVNKMNDAAQLFNEKLKLLVDQLNKDLQDAKFVYVNILEITLSLAKYFPVSNDITLISDSKVAAITCCQVNEFDQCIPSKSPCLLRNLRLFWDAFHPTEAANMITAIASYSVIKLSDVHPMDISGLA